MFNNQKGRTRISALVTLTMVGVGLGTFAPTGAAHAAELTEVTDQINSVRADSEQQGLENAGKGGLAKFAVDGDKSTYWHTPWSPSKTPLPHYLEARLSAPAAISQLKLTPRQSSNGSGRVHEYKIRTSPTCYEGEQFNKSEVEKWAVVAEGSVEANENQRDDLVVNIDKDKVKAVECLAVQYDSSWGGDGSAEQVATLAELQIFTGNTGEDTKPPAEAGELPEEMTAEPSNAITITGGDLTVKMFPKTPAVVSYGVNGHVMRGVYGTPENKIEIGKRDERGRLSTQDYDFTVGSVEHTATKVTYPIMVTGLDGVSMRVVYEVASDGYLKMSLQDIKDPNELISTVAFNKTPLVSVASDDVQAALSAANIEVNRAKNSDHFESLAKTKPFSAPKASWMAIANNQSLAAGLEGNMTIDDGNAGSSAKDIPRFVRNITQVGSAKIGTITPAQWVYRSQATKYGLSVEDNLYVKIKLVGDANSDGKVDWQDGALATRDIYDFQAGYDDVRNRVITRIPFNIVSQATHPFLRMLDDTKRISLATDNLGQQALLKGYQAEGHDSAHPDYAGHYNTRAGGQKDLTTLVDEGKKYNATFGVHLNAIETYSEARAFGDTILDPAIKAWNWMNQAYQIDKVKDIGKGQLNERLKQFREEMPDNMSFLYFDTHFPYGWQNQRMVADMNKTAKELGKTEWRIASEWAATFPHDTTWSHWAQDEAYGAGNKGYTSQIMRFVLNDTRDVWNPNSILGNTNVKEFEGWTNQQDYARFIKNVWERNLPTKFLQQSRIKTWEENKITFENGTVATSPRSSTTTNFGGYDLGTDRVITYQGVNVYHDGKYLLPWSDGGSDRLYHYNPDGGSTEWTLGGKWAGYSTLKLYKLTDDGRAAEKVLQVSGDHKVTINAEPNTAYVLYPGEKAPEIRDVKWGQGTGLNDPGFYSGNLDGYTVKGNVTVQPNQYQNREGVFGEGIASLEQQVTLPAGDYNYWTWAQIQPGHTRELSISASGEGVTPTKYQAGKPGEAKSTITQSSAKNFVGSDEKHDFGGNSTWQRLRVTFHTDGTHPVTLKIAAGAGNTEIRVDDQRLVSYTLPKDPKPSKETILFDDFENVDTSYWPLITGEADMGDSRTQMAERNEPYSQHGWQDKTIDNVLAGNWSVLAHEEGSGLVLRTSQESVNFKPGHKYRVSFDYQAAKDSNSLSVFAEMPNGTSFDRQELQRVTLPAAAGQTQKFTHEFVANSCFPVSLGFYHTSGGAWNDLALDNLRIEDLGEQDTAPACASIAAHAPVLTEGKVGEITSTLTAREGGPITDLKATITVPKGWSAIPGTIPAKTLDADGSADASWQVTAPKGTEQGKITIRYTYTEGGKQKAAEYQTVVTVVPAGVKFLSDQPVPQGAQNGWGPAERDSSNGESQPGDGTTISIGGTQYKKGLGVHAPSSLTYQVPEGCTAFKAIVGADDETGRGTISFTVKSGDQVLAGPISKKGGQKGSEVSVDLGGHDTITLEVGNGGDGNGGDHGDWAMARFVCPEPDPEPGTSPEQPGTSPEQPGTSPEQPGTSPEQPGDQNLIYHVPVRAVVNESVEHLRNAFTDVDEHTPFAGEISWMAQHQLAHGWDDGTFRPWNTVERQAVVTFLWRMAGSPTPTNVHGHFQDVPAGHQFEAPIAWAYEQGITTGWDDGTFRPDDPIQRQAFIAMAHRFCSQYEAACSPNLLKVQVEPVDHFKDVTVFNPFRDQIEWARAAKISTGWDDGTFRPDDLATRIDMAAFIYRLKNNVVVPSVK